MSQDAQGQSHHHIHSRSSLSACGQWPQWLLLKIITWQDFWAQWVSPSDKASLLSAFLFQKIEPLAPLQCSCLENPRDGGAWWAAIYGVAQSRTWLKWLSSSSSSPTTTLTCLKCPLQWFYLHISLRDMQLGASQTLEAAFTSRG